MISLVIHGKVILGLRLGYYGLYMKMKNHFKNAEISIRVSGFHFLCFSSFKINFRSIPIMSFLIQSGSA